jgi:GAF domain-containing protein
MAASSEQARLLELFQLQNEEGPCLDAYSSGQAVTCTDLASQVDFWAPFTEYAVDAGFECVYAFPLRLRTAVIGALNLFRAPAGPMPEADVRLAQALADVASVAILQDQATRQTEVRNLQLQHALDSRIIIEQAKGVLSERSNIEMDTAFDRMRSHARSNNLQLTAVAAQIVAGTLSVGDLKPAPRSRRSSP